MCQIQCDEHAGPSASYWTGGSVSGVANHRYGTCLVRSSGYDSLLNRFVSGPTSWEMMSNQQLVATLEVALEVTLR